jgi:hypothetical protein
VRGACPELAEGVGFHRRIHSTVKIAESPTSACPNKKAGAFQLRLLVGRFARIKLRRVRGVSEADLYRKSNQPRSGDM